VRRLVTTPPKHKPAKRQKRKRPKKAMAAGAAQLRQIDELLGWRGYD
jgi:hypothetical protein